MLRIKNFSLSTQQRALIETISFDVAKGQVLSLMGPSGIGKSSLLHYLSGHLASSLQATGEIFLDDVSLHDKPAEQRKVGLLQQSPLLFPHMSIMENLLFAIPEGKAKKDRKNLAIEALEKLKIRDKANSLPSELSGGQQARVALLRTLLAEPDYLLLDEPFSKLDPALKRDVRSFVLEEIRQANIPALLVTHDEEDAEAMRGNRLFLPFLT